MATPLDATTGIALSEYGLIAIGIIIGYFLHWFKGVWGKITSVKSVSKLD